VGSRVGVVVGEKEGVDVGSGVDFPGKYVGEIVGTKVGGETGDWDGFGVAFPGR